MCVEDHLGETLSQGQGGWGPWPEREACPRHRLEDATEGQCLRPGSRLPDGPSPNCTAWWDPRQAARLAAEPFHGPPSACVRLREGARSAGSALVRRLARRPPVLEQEVEPAYGPLRCQLETGSRRGGVQCAPAGVGDQQRQHPGLDEEAHRFLPAGAPGRPLGARRGDAQWVAPRHRTWSKTAAQKGRASKSPRTKRRSGSRILACLPIAALASRAVSATPRSRSMAERCPVPEPSSSTRAPDRIGSSRRSSPK